MTGVKEVAGVLIKDKRLLVLREHSTSLFRSPGGKVEPGESNERVLMRKLKEELGIETVPKDFSEFGSYKAETSGKVGAMLEMGVLIVHSYQGAMRPGVEIAEIAWVDSRNEAALELDSIFEKYVIPELAARKLID